MIFFFLRKAALTFRWRLMLTLLNYKTYLKSDAKSLYDTSTAAVLVWGSACQYLIKTNNSRLHFLVKPVFLKKLLKYGRYCNFCTVGLVI